ncbi:MAG: Xylose isomerase domain protein barrel [Actinomycetia bacterium]|nr:Xylose isomerase domain protein barrel [Actinomycetes bacterium]
MTTSLGMCTGTLLPDPMGETTDEQVQAAAAAARAAGFTQASVWAHQLEQVLTSGLEVVAIEAAMAWATGTPEAAAAEARYFCSTAASVGATKICAVTMDATWPGIEPAREKLAVLVDGAREVGAQVCVEFLPWSVIPDLATAWALVEPLGPDAGILLDTWHWQRQPGGPDLPLLATIPGERIGYVQICDAAPEPVGDPLTEAMTDRWLPGDGAVDFDGLFEQLAAIGATPWLATEIFNPSLVKSLGAADTAKAMREAALSVLT